MNGDQKTPQEIPTEKQPNPNQSPPLKDPMTPNETNPINPITDEVPDKK